jgi:hypothetical protein
VFPDYAVAGSHHGAADMLRSAGALPGRVKM